MSNKNQITPSILLNVRGTKWCCQSSTVCNEKGIALVMILILAAIALLVIAGLLYMITSSSQITGMQKRYKSGLEASLGGAEVAYQIIALRGISTDTTAFTTLLSSINPVITTPTGCSGTDLSGTTFTGLAAKLMTPATTWTNCDDTVSIDPSTNTSYDMQFDLGTSPDQYRVYAKIVDTVEGNSAPDYGLGGKGVVVSGSSEVTVVSMPYLYTMEMDAQNTLNPSERAKLSILYQY
jgi:hypothetical protein